MGRFLPKIGLGLLGVLLALRAGAAEPDLGLGLGGTSDNVVTGNLRLDYFSSSKSLDGRRNFFGISGEAKLRHRFSDNADAVVQVRTSQFEIGHDTNYGKGQLLEGFLSLRGNAVDWRIGKQKISWGRADGINPTDFFTPRDYTLMLPLEEDQRLAVPALRMDYHFDMDNTLSLVAAPEFHPTLVPWPADSPIQPTESRPGHGWRDIQWGARFTHVGEGSDWSLAAFRGFSTLPLLSPTAGAAGFVRYYPRIHGLGGDFAHNFGRFGVRGEIAYIKPTAQQGETPAFSPYWFAVIGGDRTFDDDWNMNLQLVVRRATRYTAPASYADPELAIAAEQNAVLYGLNDRTNFGLTSRIAARWLYDTLEVELLTVAYFRPNNYLLRPLVTYELNDNWKVFAGAEYYAGPDDSLFGQLKRNRTLFFELRRSF